MDFSSDLKPYSRTSHEQKLKLRIQTVKTHNSGNKKAFGTVLNYSKSFYCFFWYKVAQAACLTCTIFAFFLFFSRITPVLSSKRITR